MTKMKQPAISFYTPLKGRDRKCSKGATRLNYKISRYCMKIESRPHLAKVSIKGQQEHVKLKPEKNKAQNEMPLERDKKKNPKNLSVVH